MQKVKTYYPADMLSHRNMAFNSSVAISYLLISKYISFTYSCCCVCAFTVSASVALHLHALNDWSCKLIPFALLEWPQLVFSHCKWWCLLWTWSVYFELGMYTLTEFLDCFLVYNNNHLLLGHYTKLLYYCWNVSL